MSYSASDWINLHNLSKHPEGGHYHEVYRANHQIESNQAKRPICTSIYYLLQRGEFSAFHKIDADEIWHHYAGGSLNIHIISSNGSFLTQQLNDKGQFQVIVPAGCWFAAELTEHSDYALVGCTVSPGFVFEHFQLAKRAALIELYPEQHALISRLTRQ
jgi:uncharacterized protein